MAESSTEKMKKSLLEECSLLPHSSDCVSKSQPSPSLSETKEHTLFMPYCSLLPEELLYKISKNLENDDDCFDVIHARSVFENCECFKKTTVKNIYSLTSSLVSDFDSESQEEGRTTRTAPSTAPYVFKSLQFRFRNRTNKATKKRTSSSLSSSMRPDWSLLPEELLPIISKNLEDEEDCFDIIHARSVSRLWRSTFPFPSCLLRPSYSLPTFDETTLENKDFMCTLEKVPLFLFRVRAPPAASPFKYFLGRIGQDKSEGHIELPSPLQCSVKVEIRGSDPTLMKMVDCQILPLCHQYRLIGWEPKDYRRVAFLLLNKDEEDGEFVVILNYTNVLLVLTSAEMRWKRLEDVPEALCSDLVTFRGRFYAAFLTKHSFVIDPYSLEVTLLLPSPQKSLNYLVASGNDELFLVEVSVPPYDVLDFSRFECKVSRLDEEAGKWTEVSDLGDRVLFIGHLGNVCCSAKELPDGCGVTGNSILFTNEPTFAYKYGVPTGNADDDLRLLPISLLVNISKILKWFRSSNT